jgi:hypothetical protein
VLKNYPLELILRPEGTAELVDAHDRTLWASDSDEDFHEEDFDDFLTEDDLDDILAYLSDAGVLTEEEALAFEDGRYECYVESLQDAVGDDIDIEPGEILKNVTQS